MKLTPLIFYTNHLDPITYQYLIYNLEFFKKCGYKKICIEVGKDMSLDEFITKRKKLIEMYSAIAFDYLKLSKQELADIKYIDLAYLLQKKLEEAPLEEITNENFGGIVYDLKRLVVFEAQIQFLNHARTMFKIVHADMENRSIKNSFDPKRESTLTDTFKTHVKSADGGTIMIVGQAHSVSFNEKIDFEYMDFHLYNSALDKIFNFQEDNTEFNFKEAREKFPIRNTYNFNEKQIATYSDKIANTITRTIKEYESKVEYQSTKDYINHKYKAHLEAFLRYGGKFFVDAVISETLTPELKEYLEQKQIVLEKKTISNKEMFVIENINDSDIANKLRMK